MKTIGNIFDYNEICKKYFPIKLFSFAGFGAPQKWIMN
jgi:hypothetical protein